MLLAQLADAEADPANADPDADTLPSILDALATLHVEQAAAYWLRLVDRLGPEMFGSCMTAGSFSEYSGDRSGLEPYDESDLMGERDSDQLEMFGDSSEDDEPQPDGPEFDDPNPDPRDDQ